MLTLVRDQSPFDRRFHLLEGGTAKGCVVLPDGLLDVPGAVFRGKVRRTIKGRRSFVDLGLEQPGILEPKNTAHKVLPKEGDTILARILRSGWGDKGPKLTTHSDSGADAVTQDSGSPAKLLSTDEAPAGWPAADQELHFDYSESDAGSGKRPQQDGTPPLPQSLPDLTQTLRKRRVWTPSGLNLVVESTEAATTVDINSAKAARLSDEDLVRESVAASLDALGIRNIAGMILVDLPRVASTKERRRWVEETCSAHPVDYRFHGLSNLGLVELSRPRVSPALHELWRRSEYRKDIEAGSVWRAWKGRCHRQGENVALRTRADLIEHAAHKDPEVRPHWKDAPAADLRNQLYLF